MGSWIKPNTYTGIPDSEAGTTLEINGYQILKPSYFKNKAHARAFEISLVLANKKPAYSYSQRMGDIDIKVSAPVVMDTVECMDCIMFRGPPEIQLNIDAVSPNKVVHDAMKIVPSFFKPDEVVLGKKKNCRKIWFLELSRK